MGVKPWRTWLDLYLGNCVGACMQVCECVYVCVYVWASTCVGEWEWGDAGTRGHSYHHQVRDEAQLEQCQRRQINDRAEIEGKELNWILSFLSLPCNRGHHCRWFSTHVRSATPDRGHKNTLSTPGAHTV